MLEGILLLSTAELGTLDGTMLKGIDGFSLEGALLLGTLLMGLALDGVLLLGADELGTQVS